ncbi:MAG: saccharopine dehydrogenase NADP-binding domain-containing protein [Planctomycetes bacterium]|nr:saccharopine dehydrogenase NADP-binding domain-containing protein [Planctomycetota bacterium]
MARILLLGAGLVTRPLVHYLLEQTDHELTIATRTVSKAQTLLTGHPRGVARELLVDDHAALEAAVADHDLAISLLPYTYHVRVARLCLKHHKHMVTTSYISPEMRGLDAEARAAGITILNEIGVDPGIDHMSAMRVIDDVKRRGGTVVAFSSYCGGLPAPEANTNPWGYKFSWSPRGVLLAGLNDGRYLSGGRVIDIPGKDLFAHYEVIDVPGAGEFEGYTNRNCLGYIDLYGLTGIPDMFRGTLRYPGWCNTMKAVVDLGLLDATPRSELRGKTFRQMVELLVPDAAGEDDLRGAVAGFLGIEPDSEPMSRLQWLGLFGDDPLPDAPSVLDVLVARMLEKLAYASGERDMLVLYHRFQAQFADHRETISSTLVDFGIPGGDSSMSRTVSLPAAIATRLILTGEISAPGVLAPVTPDIYEPVLTELESMGIVCEERRETLGADNGETRSGTSKRKPPRRR